jgi:hypothetical protein
MKKGCFVRAIIIITILTAALLYIVKHKFHDLIFIPGKHVVISKLNKKLDFLKDSPEKDSLKILIDDYVNNIKDTKDINDESIQAFADSLSNIVQDGVVNKTELRNFSEIVKKQINSSNERSKKNRD